VVAVDVDDGDEPLRVGPGAGEEVPEVEAQQLLLRRIEQESPAGRVGRYHHLSFPCLLHGISLPLAAAILFLVVLNFDPLLIEGPMC
jgi:hypothetical protein